MYIELNLKYDAIFGFGTLTLKFCMQASKYSLHAYAH
jgi:hypothetical protein